MQFIDEVKIYLRSGDGGNGAVSFRREKYIERGGPDGGDGGRGGSIIFITNPHINTLLNFRYSQHFKAGSGENGKGSNMTGKSAEDVILEVPLGTQIFSEGGNMLYDLSNANQEFKILQGGKGGLGNTHFKSSINQAPYHRTSGESGEEMWIHLKLKLISDAGLIGLPNAGKSTFLARTTAAHPKIADYPFTTLSPGLGVAQVDDNEFVLADIPGLIEGASEGHGLGDRFLKHIERCRILIHLVDIFGENIAKDYTTIRKELEAYSPTLSQKTEIVCLNKCDGADDVSINEKLSELKSVTHSPIFLISAHTGKGVTDVLRQIVRTITEKDE
jgi:GTPase